MAYEYHYHSNDPGIYTQFAGDNPPKGAIVDFYQTAPQKKAPSLQILDAGGAVIRTVSGTHKVKGKEEPYVPNKAGINRYVWDFTEDAPAKWHGAAREEYQGPKTGPTSRAGNVHAFAWHGRQTLTQKVTVKPDPRDQWTQQQYESGYAFARKYSTIYGKIDEVLNNLDTIKKSLTRVAASAKNDAAIASQVTAAQQSWGPVFAAFTADYKNDEDSIQRAGSLRESIPRTGFGGPQLPPTAEQLDYATALRCRIRRGGRAVQRLRRTAFAATNCLEECRHRAGRRRNTRVALILRPRSGLRLAQGTIGKAAARTFRAGTMRSHQNVRSSDRVTARGRALGLRSRSRRRDPSAS